MVKRMANKINAKSTSSHHKRVTLVSVNDLDYKAWRILHSFFKNRELADWNGAQPLRMPFFIFKYIMKKEEQQGERIHFGILNEEQKLIGSAELYNLRPSAPATPTTATLGIMIGFPELWGKGYGREATTALLKWAFTQHRPVLQQVRLITFGHNHRAQRAFLACGFEKMGHSHENDYVNVHMRIKRESWLADQTDQTD